MVKYRTHCLEAVPAARADPARRGILLRLASKPSPPPQLAAAFLLSLLALTQHLQVLRRAKRGCRPRYRLAAAPLAKAALWFAGFHGSREGPPDAA